MQKKNNTMDHKEILEFVRTEMKRKKVPEGILLDPSGRSCWDTHDELIEYFGLDPATPESEVVAMFCDGLTKDWAFDGEEEYDCKEDTIEAFERSYDACCSQIYKDALNDVKEDENLISYGYYHPDDLYGCNFSLQVIMTPDKQKVVGWNLGVD